MPGFPQDVQVAVTAAPDVPCDATYRLALDVELDVTGGADFGQDADGKGIRKVSLAFDVQVGCAAAVLEGCSQGFWKNHTAAWQTLDPADSVGAVFASAAAYGLGDATLHEALGFQGGSSLTAAALDGDNNLGCPLE